MRSFLGSFLTSLQHAADGLRFAFATQRNMRIHFFFAILVLLFGLILGISKWEVLLVFVAIVFVMVAELFNTAVEQLVDLVTEKNYYPQAKVAKDVAAGGVLLTAGFAVLAGLAVFYQPLVERDGYLHMMAERTDEPLLIAGLTLLFFTTLVLQVWLRGRIAVWVPSMMMGLLTCFILMLGLLYPHVIGLGKSFFIWLFLFALLYFWRQLSLLSLLLGSLLGGLVALLSFQLYY